MKPVGSSGAFGSSSQDEVVWRVEQEVDHEDVRTLVNLACEYLEEEGVENDREALRLLRLAAGEGDAEGQYNLGLMHLKGRGVEKNELQAPQKCRGHFGFLPRPRGPFARAHARMRMKRRGE